MIRILTLANKPDYLPQAIRSVLRQTRTDIVHVVGLDDGSRSWGGRYPPGVFYSEEARRADMEDYIIWLSDDDLMLPRCCEVLAGYLDEHPGVDCVYGITRGVMHEPGKKPVFKMFAPKKRYGLPRFDAHNLPGFKIDSGQFMVRRSALERVPYPYAPPVQPRRADGHMLNNIARHVTFWPVNEVVTVNRITPESSHRRNVGGEYTGFDWRRTPKWSVRGKRS